MALRGIIWLAAAVVAGLVVIAAAIIAVRDLAPGRPPPASAALSAPKPVAVAPTAPPPSFDIVSVDRYGQAVIAGRAMPGDRVKVLDGDQLLGEVTADERGEWALVPNAPLAPGDRQLSLAAVPRDGGPIRRSVDTVALSVASPSAARGGAATLAVLLPGDARRPARLLQAAPHAAGQTLALDTVEYDAGDRLMLSGHAQPGARVDVYAGDRLLGTAAADSAGKWSLVAAYPKVSGGVELRLDEIAANGAIAHQIAGSVAAPGIALAGSYVVRRGNSLWLIARQVYGEGMRYTVIYHANREQIHDPALIYPGQQFKLPKS
jgi:hypothetical protein